MSMVLQNQQVESKTKGKRKRGMERNSIPLEKMGGKLKIASLLTMMA